MKKEQDTRSLQVDLWQIIIKEILNLYMEKIDIWFMIIIMSVWVGQKSIKSLVEDNLWKIKRGVIFQIFSF